MISPRQFLLMILLEFVPESWHRENVRELSQSSRRPSSPPRGEGPLSVDLFPTIDPPVLSLTTFLIRLGRWPPFERAFARHRPAPGSSCLEWSSELRPIEIQIESLKLPLPSELSQHARDHF